MDDFLFSNTTECVNATVPPKEMPVNNVSAMLRCRPSHIPKAKGHASQPPEENGLVRSVGLKMASTCQNPEVE